MTKKQKQEIKTHLSNISNMGRMELSSFDMKLQEVKGEMDDVVWSEVNSKVVLQMAGFTILNQ